MMRTGRLGIALATLLAVLATSIVAPSAALGRDPFPAGSLILPNGRVLLPPPAGTDGPSIHAEMLETLGQGHFDFTPGERPSVSLASHGQAAALAPAATDASAASLASMLVPGTTSADSGPLAALPNGLRKEILGFLPYWMLTDTALASMNYHLLSTIAYFSVGTDRDGNLLKGTSTSPSSGWAGWTSSRMTSVINTAHTNGVRVALTVTMMASDSTSAANMATLLGSSTARANLVGQIVAAVRDRLADGVNLDFEPVSSTLRAQYTSFARELKAGLVAGGVGSYLTVCTTGGAATWATGYDVAGLTASGAADQLFVMGYDYSWSGSARAGGVAPIDSAYTVDLNGTMADYLAETSGSKIIWGVPYYGRTWPTSSDQLNATTVAGTSHAYVYTGMLTRAAQYGRLWDDTGKVPWFRYLDPATATWVQGYYDDVASLGAKYDLVNARGFAGTGMWTLLMDQGQDELWKLLAAKFVNDTEPPVGGIKLLPETNDASAVLVAWRAIDYASGVDRYNLQVRQIGTDTWQPWLTGTTASSAWFVGSPGMAYEFRVSAVDIKGNAQPWLPASLDPGVSLALGGFARAAVDNLNLRTGAGTGFAILDKLSAGAMVALLSGPVSASGYQWYQVQYGFTEWPSSEYAKVAWVAAGSGSTPYLVVATPPTRTAINPVITGYSVAPRTFSPDGNGSADSVVASFTLPLAASQVRLDVLSATGDVVAGTDIGPLAAGARQAVWDGKLAAGGTAAAGAYLLRITAVDVNGTHVAPAPGVDPALLTAWGVTVDLQPPTAAGAQTGPDWSTTIKPTVTFSEPVSGVAAATFSIVDTSTGQPVGGSVSYLSTTRTATFSPSVAFVPGHTYTASAGGDIRDEAGNPLAAASWTFVTTALVTNYSPARSISFLAGTYTGQKFDAAGHVIATRTYTLTKSSSAPASQRNAALPGQSGAWYSITAGIWAGYWVKESPSVYLPGIASRENFSPLHVAAFALGTYTGYRFDATWRYVVATKTYSLGKSSSASAASIAVINGRRYALITNGVWANFWIPLSSSVIVY